MPFTAESRKDVPGRGPSKLNRTVKETVLGVFLKLQDDKEAAHTLENWAKLNPSLFYPIAAKLIPTEITSTLRRVIKVNISNGEDQPKVEDADFEEVKEAPIDTQEIDLSFLE